jgi:outer membrane receptor for ferrienterochelin and colicins
LLDNTKATISGEKHMYWVNIGKAMTQGAEINLMARLGANLKGNFTYTYLETENKETGKELDERPQNTVTLSLDWQAPYGTQVQLSGKYRGERYSDSANTVKLDAYTTVDLNVEKKLTDKYSIYVKAKNLLDEEDIDDADDLDGVEYYLGVQARL